MGCCVGAKHGNWCKDYDIVFMDAAENEYCIFHAPLGRKYTTMYIDGNGQAPPSEISHKDFNNLVFSHINKNNQKKSLLETNTSNTLPTKAPTSSTCDLSGSVFPAKISFHEDFVFDLDISFAYCHFNGSVDFNNKFNGDISFKKAVFKDNLFMKIDAINIDFESSIFEAFCQFLNMKTHGAYFKFASFTQGVSFHNVTFGIDNSTVSFYGCKFNLNTEFIDANFEGIVSFSNSTFEHDTIFKACVFKKTTEFSGTHFCGKTKFNQKAIDNSERQTSFLDMSRFVECSFDGRTEFSGVNFKTADFTNTQFNAATTFKNCKFKTGYSYFSGVVFGSNVLFDKVDFKFVKFNVTQFERNIRFSNMTIYGGLQAVDAHFHAKTIFNKTKFYGYTNFHSTTFEDTAFIKNSELNLLIFNTLDIESINFIECEWPKDKSTKHNIIYDEKDNSREKPSLGEIESLYRRLKKVARDNADEMQTSNWHYKEKEMQRKRLKPAGYFYQFTTLYILTWSLSVFLIPSPHQIAFSLIMTLGLLFGIGIYLKFIKTDSFKNEFLKFCIQAYFSTSGYGEEPGKACSVLIQLLFLSLIASLALPDLTSKSSGQEFEWLNQWLWYLPLTKIDAINPSGWNSLWKIIFNLALPLQAALLAFALRNKLRR